jgi:shikimate dehydrogenase
MSEGPRAACIIGWPVKHSRSPVIHNYWLKHYGIDGVYRREAIAPNDVADFFAHLADRGYVGCNVTLPHKEAAFAASEPDDRARAIGAANTLWLDGGHLYSTNTDIEGFTANLDATVPGWETGCHEAVVLGAGGSALAVVYGLIEREVPVIHVINRTAERAEAMRERFGATVRPAHWGALPRLVTRAQLLVNTTSLGMTGQDPLELDLSPVPGDAIVVDLVYAPLKTALLAAAEARGLATADGLGMLLYQAVRGFQQWFGVRPEVTTELRALVEADLARDRE